MAQDSLRRRKRERRVRAALATTGGPCRISAAAEFADFLSDVRRGVVQGVRATSRQAPTCFPSSPDMLPVKPRRVSCRETQLLAFSNIDVFYVMFVLFIWLDTRPDMHPVEKPSSWHSPISTCSMSCSRSSSGWVRAVAAPSQMAFRRQA